MNKRKTLGLGLSILILDQLTKFVAKNFGTASLNTGGILGIGEGLWWLVGGLLVLLWLGYSLFKKSLWTVIDVLLVLVLFAGVSNLLDRVIYGGVWDWICYPVILVCGNFADIVLTVVVAIYFFYGWKGGKHEDIV